jgi:hypothetical protein
MDDGDGAAGFCPLLQPAEAAAAAAPAAEKLAGDKGAGGFCGSLGRPEWPGRLGKARGIFRRGLGQDRGTGGGAVHGAAARRRR